MYIKDYGPGLTVCPSHNSVHLDVYCMGLQYRLAILDLGSELLCHIFSFLEQQDGLRTVRMVCRAFRVGANETVSLINIFGVF